ncbi:unnamed protein product [Periconia digitata]|uniref:Uncharacterized protein n=1 Tax=Periconia digitata TaxID=1303443 RepID=A0A9W4UET6_9PLEO|nr:unnamed protein product [Periconia digitata]
MVFSVQTHSPRPIAIHKQAKFLLQLEKIVSTPSTGIFIMPVSTIPYNDDPRPHKHDTAACPVLTFSNAEFPTLLEAMSFMGHMNFPVMKLPAEIREKIWEQEILEDCDYLERMRIEPYVADSPKCPTFLPRRALASKQMMNEIVPVFIKLAKFAMSSIGDNEFFCSFLDSVPKGRAYVRRLRFDFFDCVLYGHPENLDLKLAASCSGLREIQLTFHWRNVRRPVDAIVQHYHLKMLLNCKQLSRVILITMGYYSIEALETLHDLGQWIENQFHDQGQTVKYSVL